MGYKIVVTVLILLFLQGCGYTFVPADRWRNTQANLAKCHEALQNCNDTYNGCTEEAEFQSLKATASIATLNTLKRLHVMIVESMRLELVSTTTDKNTCESELKEVKETCEDDA